MDRDSCRGVDVGGCDIEGGVDSSGVADVIEVVADVIEGCDTDTALGGGCMIITTRMGAIRMAAIS